MKKIQIAIDGLSACGKSTLAKNLAIKIGYKYIDSGAMYRAVTYFAVQNNIIGNDFLHKDSLINSLNNEIEISFIFDENKNNCVTLNGQNIENHIRSLEISNFVSIISAIPDVRKKMVEIQKKLGEDKGIVMEGRDIGTVVFPNAELKIFVTADLEIRAQRRLKELTENMQNIDIENIKNSLKNRDFADCTRKDSPLKQAEEAIVIDSSNLTKSELLECAYNLYLKVIENIKNP